VAMQATWNGAKASLPDEFVRWMEQNIVNER